MKNLKYKKFLIYYSFFLITFSVFLSESVFGKAYDGTITIENVDCHPFFGSNNDPVKFIVSSNWGGCWVQDPNFVIMSRGAAPQQIKVVNEADCEYNIEAEAALNPVAFSPNATVKCRLNPGPRPQACYCHQQ